MMAKIDAKSAPGRSRRRVATRFLVLIDFDPDPQATIVRTARDDERERAAFEDALRRAYSDTAHRLHVRHFEIVPVNYELPRRGEGT